MGLVSTEKPIIDSGLVKNSILRGYDRRMDVALSRPRRQLAVGDEENNLLNGGLDDRSFKVRTTEIGIKNAWREIKLVSPNINPLEVR